MGLFDRFTSRKGQSGPEPGQEQPPAPPPPGNPAPPAPGAGGARPRLQAAHEKLEARNLPEALAIYEEVLATAGDRADVLVTVSGDLGSFGHVRAIIDLIAPRYVAERHGPAAGFNLLQAYLAVRDANAAQHLLDILFALQRPELEERLHGFSNAISDLMLTEAGQAEPGAPPAPPGALVPAMRKVSLVSISKPVWFYGLEPLADRILPRKEGKPRRIAFAQMAIPGAYANFDEAARRPEDEIARLSRALPAWLAETFFFSPSYLSFVAVAGEEDPGTGTRRPFSFGEEWGTETIRQLVDTTSEGLDYVITGALSQRSGDYEASFRIWEVRKFRERKQLTFRWTPATADEELARVRQTLCQYMEWSAYPAGSGGLAYSAPSAPRAWLDALGASLGLFLAEKGLWPKDLLPAMAPSAASLAALAPGSESASLAWITLERRLRALGLPPEPRPATLFDSDLVRTAEGSA